MHYILVLKKIIAYLKFRLSWILVGVLPGPALPRVCDWALGGRGLL